MVDSTSDAIIANPQAIITKIFESSTGVENPSMSSDFDIPKTFESAFSEPTQLAKIPYLDSLPHTSLKSGTLVRFLGMVQDTSYSQEIYIGMTRTQNKWKFHRYVDSAPVDTDIQSPDTVLDERNGVYVTSIPGCSRWFENDSMEGLALGESVLNGDKERIVGFGGREVGVVVQCYSGVDRNLSVCDLVEVIGILEMPEHVEQISQEEEEDEEERERTDVVIHAVTIQKKSLEDMVLSKYGELSQGITTTDDTNLDDLSKAKELFIQHVSGLFDGDVLAAKSLLLNLTSTRHPNIQSILSMNIHSLPTSSIPRITAFLKSILPAVAVESISIDGLNKQRIYPKSDGEKLCAGRGQFVTRTQLIIDNSNLQEGKLFDMGVRNLAFLTRVTQEQKLQFEFPYFEFSVDTDIPVLVLGESKAFIPVTVAFPLVKGEMKSVPVTQEDLVLLRRYVAQIARLKIIIAEDVADEMAKSFVTRRKEIEGKGIDEDWFGLRIVVAKGLARVNARETVTKGDWEESIATCSQWEMRRK